MGLSFKEERRVSGELVEKGLRVPQLGALHAALAHWSVSEDPGTVVMPTGTGKTETMLALLVHQRPERLLVVVPNSALRGQTAAKFETLGVLVDSGVVGAGALFPVVGTLEHVLGMPDDVEEYFGCCNVVVTTMNVVGGCSVEVRRRMAEMCSHLFVDEAHHVPAPTWEGFRALFAEKRVLQFTATPYRGDGRQVEGRIVYNYPLRKAQAEDYFRRIDFRPVREFRRGLADEEIAREAVGRLDLDLGAGLRHVVMARTSSIDRARRVHEIYGRVASGHEPLLIHSKMSALEKREAMRKLRTGEAKVAVCVNMLGEGFDLPELKIAALHDAHKSLPVTLQFIGRFTRARDDLGGATVVANVVDPKIEESLA
jgi:superfamily II DNA or RNA helicase